MENSWADLSAPSCLCSASLSLCQGDTVSYQLFAETEWRSEDQTRENQAMPQILPLAYPLERISRLGREAKTLPHDFPDRPPRLPLPDGYRCQDSIKHIDFFRAYYLCPKLWEILSTLFFLHLKHEKKILWPASFEGLWEETQLSFSIWRISSDQCRAEREKGGPELGAYLSGHMHLCLSPASHRKQPSLLKDCQFNSLRSRLGSSIPGEPFLLSEGRSHLLVQTLFLEGLKPPVSFPWFQSILSSAVWWPHYSLWCSTQKKICASAT